MIQFFPDPLPEIVARPHSDFIVGYAAQPIVFEKTGAETLPLDGRVLKQEDYPELYEVIAKVYGPADDDEFKLPDLRGRVIVAAES